MQQPRIRPMGNGLQLCGRNRDGTQIPVEVSISPVHAPGGILISANVRDISDRRRGEALMRRIQDHLLSAVESIQGAFAIFDASDRLVLCNSEFRQLLASAYEHEVVGRSFAELVDASIRAGVFALTPQSAPEFRSAWLAYHAHPLGGLDTSTSDGRHVQIVERSTAEGGVVTTIWDVTETFMREDELRKARELAEAASSAKSEFLASMSHELRTPLNAILGFAQLLQRDKREPLSTRHRERVEHVLKGGEHLLRLIDDILDLSRIEAGRVAMSLEPVSVADAMLEVKTTLEPMAQRASIRIELSLPDADTEITADRTRFQQILMNYGSNAIKYGKAGGLVRFETEPEGGMLRVTVADDGDGIPLEKHDTIFQPFQRAGQETGTIEGTGIGLTITKRLAELMAGAVGFRSEPGQGSLFWVDLPLRHKASTSAPPPALIDGHGASLLGREGPRYRIVYVEDNPSSLALMTDLIADFERVELITAPTAEIGIELVRAHMPDAVIMDINLPGMSGFEATRRLKQWPQTQAIPVIALSAAAMVRDASKVQHAGFYRYLTKPVKVDELASTLEEILQKR
jgi:signal transduction histidine kinase